MTWREQLVYALNDSGSIILWWLTVMAMVLMYKGCHQ